MQRDTSEIFQIVRVIIARNLEIDIETIDLEFKFNHFIDSLREATPTFGCLSSREVW
jgi:hypothetical protein